MSFQDIGGDSRLAPYASDASRFRGRFHKEDESSSRSPFQRDRDRIIHSSAFRRLTHKTQVFVFHEGDHYRTRLTHSLEVAQIARTISGIIRLDEYLAETLALAHDLGHPPFGHAGERALNRVMKNYGGFDHNAQSLRIVSDLEHKYAEFDGLNLTWETLEGLVKHNGPLMDKGYKPVGRYAEEGIPDSFLEFNELFDLELSGFASAEAQVAAIADDIAYNNHDVDDGLRAGVIQLDQLNEMPITARIMKELNEQYVNLEQRRIIYELNRRLITRMVEDVAEVGRQNFEKYQPQSAEDIRMAGVPMIHFSEQMTEELDELRFFLISWVYRDIRVERIMSDAARIVQDLFEVYMDSPSELPEYWKVKVSEVDKSERARLICDFVAGMTDRFAMDEHRRLFDFTPELR